MIEVKIKDRELKDKYEIVRRADLKTALFNAAIGPHMKPGSKFPYKIKSFLPKYLKLEKEEISEAEKTKRWIEAGDAMMEVVREHERETGVKV